MEPVVFNLVEALRRTLAGTVVRDVLDRLGEQATDVQVVAVSASARVGGERGTGTLLDAFAVNDLATETKRLVDESGGALIVTDLEHPDRFLAVAPLGAVVVPEDVRIDGESLRECLETAGEYQESVNPREREVDSEDDRLQNVIRTVVSDETLVPILLALPLDLVRSLADVAKGAPSSLLRLLGPGSWLVLVHHHLVALGDPVRLTVLGERVSSAAAAVTEKLGTG